ncbi:MAG: sulfite exporter TauE/SafE family protein [Ekhidna sp.]|uniref:sulfite exporter TauE/SafE family protein n=1 Tax=Ekhidna sp. TaxID=2608089 RepID=UPI0032ED463E
MTLLEGAFLIGAGIFAGFVNTVAGGGSLLTLPLLIFLGLPSSEANASNRVAIFAQNIFSVAGFRSKGVRVFPFAIYVAIPAMIGAIIGSKIAVDIDETLFNRILAVIMLMVMGITVFKPKVKTQAEEMLTSKKVWISVIAFFFVGIYGGFIQAGIGFIMIAALTGIHGFRMAKTNAIKVFVALTYTSAALVVFYLSGKIRWEYGLVLATGQALGGWVASRWSVGVSDRVIRMILLVMVVALSIKLWFF